MQTANTPPHRHLFKLLLLTSLIAVMASCHTVRVNLGPACQPTLNDEQGFWKDKQFTDTTIRLKPFQSPLMTIGCINQCVCAMEYKVGFGQALLSGITLGLVRRVSVRFGCCQPQNF